MHNPRSKSDVLVSMFAVLAFVMMPAHPAFSQSSNGNVRGSVRDQTDSVIPEPDSP